MNKKIKWVGTLSTTERNHIGLIRVRQNNVNSEVLGFNVVDGAGEPYDLKNRKVLFCTYFDKFAPIEQYAEVIENGKIVYTMNQHDMQKPVRINFAYFKILDEKDNLVDTTQNFSYDIMPSIESKCMNSEPYIIRLEEVLDAFLQINTDAKKELEQIIIDFNQQVIEQQQNFDIWFESIREILESIDPGGVILNELVDFRYSELLDKHFNRMKDRGDFWDELHSNRGIDVTAFGALPGDNENAKKINDAIQFAKLKGINKIFIPKSIGMYDINSAIILENDFEIESNGAVINCLEGNYSSSGIGSAAFINKKENGQPKGINIKGLEIQCNRNSQHGIRIYSELGVRSILLEDIDVYNPQWDGVIIQGSIEQSSGDVKPWLDLKAARRVTLNNVTCINENTTLQTRTGFMIEHTYKFNVNDCYATGFNTGFHVEGSASLNFNGCVAEDNNYDWQRADNTNYGSDFMIGRSSNVSMTNSSARRINNDLNITYPDGTKWTYKTLYMPAPFQDGLKLTNCNFSGGEIRGNETGTESTKNRFGQSFINCNFNDVYLVFARSLEGSFFEGVNFTGNSFTNSQLQLTRTEGYSLSSNIFVNTDKRASLIIEYSRYGSMTGNIFKGGDSSNSVAFRKSQVILNNVVDSSFSDNSLLIDGRYEGFYALGLNSCFRLKVLGNSFNMKRENAIKEQYNTEVAARSVQNIIKDNTMIYSEEFEEGIYIVDTSKNIIKDNIINGKVA